MEITLIFLRSLIENARPGKHVLECKIKKWKKEVYKFGLRITRVGIFNVKQVVGGEKKMPILVF